MSKYVLAYRGGGDMAPSEEEQAQIMQAWMGWFGELGAAVVDGGAPFGPSVSIGGGGAVGPVSGDGLTGYSILQADSLAAAQELAKGCPVLTAGGRVEVYETIDMEGM
ncbi:MAG: YciI family protein [Acidimicrobiales bacterium]